MSEVVMPITPEQNGNATQPSAAPKVHKGGWQRRLDVLVARNHEFAKRVVELEASNTYLVARNHVLTRREAELGAQVEDLLVVLDERRRVMEEHAELIETENRILEVQVAHTLAAKGGS